MPEAFIAQERTASIMPDSASHTRRLATFTVLLSMLFIATACTPSFVETSTAPAPIGEGEPSTAAVTDVALGTANPESPTAPAGTADPEQSPNPGASAQPTTAPTEPPTAVPAPTQTPLPFGDPSSKIGRASGRE